ncbi:MAG: hypothetical protein QMD80_08320 [archaeon]|nr:hypothetical protein [archaeon]
MDIEKKNLIREVIGALVNAFFLPGLGQVIVGRVMKGVELIVIAAALFFGGFYLVIGFMWGGRPEIGIGMFLLLILGAFVVWVYALVDVIIGEVRPLRGEKKRRMKRSTLITLVTMVIVFTVVGAIAGLFAFAIWEDWKLQQGEVLSDSGVEVTDFQLVLHDEEGGCDLIANVTNKNNFSLAWVGIDINYTRNGKEETEWDAIKHFKPDETKRGTWWLSLTCEPEYCNEERYKDFKVVSIRAYKYKNGE